MEYLLLIIKILIYIFSIIGVLILLYFILNFWKTKQVNKSVSKDVFKGKLSIFILLLFYFFSFGLIGGLTTYNDKEENAANKLVVTERNIGHGYLIPGNVSLQDYDEYSGSSSEGIQNRNWKYLYEDFFDTDYDGDNFYENFILPLINNEQNYQYLFDNFTFEEYTKTYYYYWYQYYLNDSFPIDDFDTLKIEADQFWEESDDGSSFFGDIQNIIGINLFYKNIISASNQQNPDSIYNLYGQVDYDIQLQYVYSSPFTDDEIAGSSPSYLFLGFNRIEDSFLRSETGEYSSKIDVPIINQNFTNLSDQQLLNDVFGADYDNSNESIYGNGTNQNPYKVLMIDSYYQANKDFFEDNNNLFTVGPYYFEVVATGWFPNVSYPVHNINNILTDVDNEQTMMLNNYALADIAAGKQDFVIYYGFEDIYQKTDSYEDIILGPISDDIEDQAYYITDYAEGNYRGNSFGNNTYYDYSYNNEINNDTGNDIVAARADAFLLEVKADQSFTAVFRFIFLIVVIIILILLIQKRINDNSKNLGTLKALGMSNLKISSSYILYPIIITTIGAFIALLLAIPVGMYFVNIITSYFAIPISTSATISLNSFLIVYISPLLITCGISLLISYYVLRKPTLNLLQGAQKNKPGLITIYLGKLIPSSFSFSKSYKIKSLFRSTGKSVILFFSMIFSTFLIALSFSGSTMVSNVIDEVGDEINYQSLSILNSDLKYLPSYYQDDSEDWYQNINDNSLDLNFQYSAIYWDFSEINASTTEDKYQQMGDIILNADYIYSYDQINNQYDISYLSAESLLNYFKFLQNNPDLISYSDQNFTGTNVSNSDLLVISFYFWQYSYLNYLSDANNSKISVNQFISETLSIYDPNLGLDSFSENYQDNYIDISFGNYFYNSDQQALLFSDNIKFETEDENDTYRLLSLNDINQINDNMFKNIPELDKAITDFNNYPQDEVDANGNYYLPIITSDYYYNKIKNVAQYQGVDQYGYETYQGRIEYKDQNTDTKQKNVTFVIIGTYESYITNSIYTTRDAISLTVDDQLSYIPYLIYSQDFKRQVYSFAFSSSLIDQIIINDGNYNISLEQILNDNYAFIEQLSIDNDLVFDQVNAAYSLVSGLLIIICAFAFFISFVLISITIKVVADNSLNEVSMLKVFGYTNWKATSLVMTSYIIILAISFIVSISLIFVFLLGLSTILTNLTGTTYTFVLTGLQLAFLIAIILILIVVLLVFVYITFAKLNPLDAIKRTE
ncbi:MAG: hypothetical protein HPPSJP_0140 [Candidatus Hepatoplasma scabrum]|nr:MAG: hypothetical protein HPPSJP_0140 [Candidatus Hepatoplasma sp.]